MTKKNRCTERINRLLFVAAGISRMQDFSLGQIAERYGVSERTARRDIDKLKEFFPLERYNGKWRIDLHENRRRHGLLADSLLQAFAENLRIESTCLDPQRSDSHLVDFAVRYHRLPRELGETLLKMMTQSENARFDYTDKEGAVTRRRVAPVKLLHAQGLWYLIAYDFDRKAHRTFRLDHIRHLLPLSGTPPLDPAIRKRLESIVDPWQQSDAPKSIDVRLYADAHAASYLRDIPLHSSQKTEELHNDGGALFSYRLSHEMELLPRIKSWIPHLRILEPLSLKKMLHEELKSYLDENFDM